MILLGEANVVKQDIDFILENWEFKPGVAQARMIQAQDGRQVVQLRIDLGDGTTNIVNISLKK